MQTKLGVLACAFSAAAVACLLGCATEAASDRPPRAKAGDEKPRLLAALRANPAEVTRAMNANKVVLLRVTKLNIITDWQPPRFRCCLNVADLLNPCAGGVDLEDDLCRLKASRDTGETCTHGVDHVWEIIVDMSN
jgi:hypothetical protein